MGNYIDITAPVEWPFVRAVPEDLKCPICLSAAVDAVVTDACGHLFCHVCITEALGAKKACPCCSAPLTVDGIRKDLRAQRRINALRARCTNSDHGCRWAGDFGQLGGHLEGCEHGEVECPFRAYGCVDGKILRKSLPGHMGECVVTMRLAQGDVALQQEMSIRQRKTDGCFVWVFSVSHVRGDVLRSRTFEAHGLKWYLSLSSKNKERPGVYLFRVDHSKRADFTLTLFNADCEKDKAGNVNGWAADPKADCGYGIPAFLPDGDLRDAGLIVSGFVRIGVTINKVYQ